MRVVIDGVSYLLVMLAARWTPPCMGGECSDACGDVEVHCSDS